MTTPPPGKVATVWFSGIAPLAFEQTAPLLAAHVQVPEAMPFGSGSATTVFGAATLPVLVAVTV